MYCKSNSQIIKLTAVNRSKIGWMSNATEILCAETFLTKYD